MANIKKLNKRFDFTEDNPSDKKENETYRLPRRMIEGVRVKAKQERRTKSAVAEKAIGDYLENTES